MSSQRLTSQNRLKAGLVALAMVLTACGAESSAAEKDQELPTLETAAVEDETSTTGGDESATTPDEEVDPEVAMAEYEACMSDFGVDVSSFGDSSSGAEIEPRDDGAKVFEAPEDFDIDAFQEAQAECESILQDAFGDFEMTPEQEAEFADEMLEMTKCLAERGFDVDLQGGAFELDENVDFNAFNEAMNECQPDSIGVLGSDSASSS